MAQLAGYGSDAPALVDESSNRPIIYRLRSRAACFSRNRQPGHKLINPGGEFKPLAPDAFSGEQMVQNSFSLSATSHEAFGRQFDRAIILHPDKSKIRIVRKADFDAANLAGGDEVDHASARIFMTPSNARDFAHRLFKLTILQNSSRDLAGMQILAASFSPL